MLYLAYQIVSSLLGGDVDLNQHFLHSEHSAKVTKAGKGARAGFISESFNVQFNLACFER